MNQQIKSLAVLFADITGSTKLYETVGDEKARSLTSACIEKISLIIMKNNGNIVKTMGDGIMATFPDANSAFGASVEMQEAHKGHTLQITVGFHFGQVIEENKDVFGDTVNLAARVAGKAKAGEILLTEETVNLLLPPYKMATRFLDKTTLKGKSEGINIYTIIFEGDDEATVSLSSASTLMKTMQHAETKPAYVLKLSFLGQDITITGKASFIIGRDASCDLVMQTQYASRHHAEISLQRDRFMITDQSTNGTYIKTDSGEEMFLKRESASLTSSGMISLGEKPDSSSPSIICYKITTPD